MFSTSSIGSHKTGLPLLRRARRSSLVLGSVYCHRCEHQGACATAFASYIACLGRCLQWDYSQGTASQEFAALQLLGPAIEDSLLLIVPVVTRMFERRDLSAPARKAAFVAIGQPSRKVHSRVRSISPPIRSQSRSPSVAYWASMMRRMSGVTQPWTHCRLSLSS